MNNLLVVANESYQDFVSALQSEFEEDCGVVFRRLPIDAFVGLKVIRDDKEEEIDQKQSAELWNHLKASNWIANDGFILESFSKAIEDYTFVLPEVFRPATRDIVDAIEKHQMDKYISKHNPIKGRVNEKVLLDPEFEKFWSAINLKTIYSVHYATEVLIERAVFAIKKMVDIHPPKLRTTYVEVNVETRGGQRITTELRIPAKRLRLFNSLTS